MSQLELTTYFRLLFISYWRLSRRKYIPTSSKTLNNWRRAPSLISGPSLFALNLEFQSWIECFLMQFGLMKSKSSNFGICLFRSHTNDFASAYPVGAHNIFYFSFTRILILHNFAISPPNWTTTVSFPYSLPGQKSTHSKAIASRAWNQPWCF